MPTPREVIESFLGGDPVDGVSLRAAVGVLLAAWDEVLADAGRLAECDDGEQEDRTVELMGEVMTWHDTLECCEADPAPVRALPQFMSRRRACIGGADAE